MRTLPRLERRMMAHARQMNLAVEITTVGDLGTVISHLKSHGAQIYEIDLNRGSDVQGVYPCAVFSLRLEPPLSHADFLASLSLLECVQSVDEI